MPHPYQLTTPSLRDWYCHPHGADYPSAIASAASNHTTFHMTFYDSRITQFYIIRARCYIESQLPRLHIGPDFSANGEVIFTAQHTFDFALEVENSPLSLIYHHHRRACPLLFYSRGCQDTLTHWKQVSLVTIRVNVPPIVLGFLPLDPQRGQAQDTDDAWEALTSAAPGQTICLWTSVGPAQGRGLEEVWSLMKELVPLARQTEGSFWYRELHKPDREGCRPILPG
ncbi:hypothetical protein N7470_010398 [Penicillium chermesinum]|nr:hypothetical protein N7470_010398 [Penicillium chermesinum]